LIQKSDDHGLNGVRIPLPCPAQIDHERGLAEIVDFAEVLSAGGGGEFHKIYRFYRCRLKKQAEFTLKNQKDGSRDHRNEENTIRRFIGKKE
jgi:hypothetical protein